MMRHRHEPARQMDGGVSATREFLKRLDQPAFGNTSLLSPLRYPGGKRRLLPCVARAIMDLPEPPLLAVEPFAGGAAVSIGLLEFGIVPQIALADADPLVSAFWRCVFDP